MFTYGAVRTYSAYRKVFIFGALLLSATLASPMLAFADNAADAAALDALAGTLSKLGSDEGYTGAQLNALNQANAAIGAAAKNLRAKPADLAAAKKALENAKKILNAVTDWKSTSGQSTVNHAVDELQAEIDRLAAAIAAGNTGTVAGSGTSPPPLPTVPLGAKTSPLLGESTNGSPPVEAPATNPVGAPVPTSVAPSTAQTKTAPVTQPGASAPSPTAPLTTQKQFSAAQVIYQIERLRLLSALAAESPDGTAEALPLDFTQLPGAPRLRIVAKGNTLEFNLSGGGVYDVSGAVIGVNNATLDEFFGASFSVVLGKYDHLNPIGFVLSVIYRPESTPVFFEGTGGGGLKLPPAAIPGEGLSEQVGNIVTPCVGGATTKADGTPCVNNAVVPQGNEQPQSGPEITAPPTTPPEVAPSTTGAGETTVNATLEEAPTEEVVVDLLLEPETAAIGTPAPGGFGSTPSAPSYDLGGLFAGETAQTASQEVGDLTISHLLPPALPAGPIISVPTAPIVGTEGSEQVYVEISFEPVTTAPESAPSAPNFDNGGLFSPGFAPPTPLNQPAVGELPAAEGLPEYFQAGPVKPLDTDPGESTDFLLLQPNQPAVAEPEQVNATLEIADQAAQAVQSGAETANETINATLEFITP